MATFNVRVNGIPFEVSGVSSEQEAIEQVTMAGEVDPLLFQNKALSLGYDFDFETNQGRERGELSKFLIGFGKGVSDIGDLGEDLINHVHETFLEQTGADFAELQRFDAQQEQRDRLRAQNEEAFDQLEANSLTASVGEVVGQSSPFIVPGGAAVAGTWRLAKALSPFNWFRRAGKKAIKGLSDEGVSAETISAAGRTPRGQQLISQFNKVKNPSEKVIRTFGRNIKNAADEAAESAQTGASNILRPSGRNTRVRQAQERIQRTLDEADELARTAQARGTASARAPTAGGRVEQAGGPNPVLQGSDDVVQEVLRAARNRGSLTRQNDLPF